MALLIIISGLLLQFLTSAYAQEKCDFNGVTACCDSCCTYDCCSVTYDSSECQDDDNLSFGIILLVVIAPICLLFCVLCVCLLRYRSCWMLSQPQVTSVRRNLTVTVNHGKEAERPKGNYDAPPSYGSVVQREH